MSKKRKINLNKDFYRIRCDEINLFEDDIKGAISNAIEALKDHLRNHSKLIAISAPQLGYRYRIFCMKFDGNDIRTFINPLIISRKELYLNEEKQIGFEDDDIYFVPRYKEVTAGYQTPTGRVESNIFQNEAGAVFEQMIQLLDGIFISDFGLIKLDGFDEASEDEKREIFKMYAQSLLNENQIMQEHIKENKTLSQIDTLTKFYTELTLGNIELVDMTEEDKEQIRNNLEKNKKDV